MSRGFVIHREDNVATALAECRAGDRVDLVGEGSVPSVEVVETIRAEHKLALIEIPAGTDVIKFGMPIGRATRTIHRGQWVHLHNCESQYDERSQTLDRDSGTPTDIVYE
jgi:hypothetical protein